MDIRKLAAEGRTEEIERQLMDLGGEFRFKCLRQVLQAPEYDPIQSRGYL